MDLDAVVHDPGGVAEPLHGQEPLPLRGFSILHFEVHLVGDLLRASAQHDHERVAEQGGVLLARQRAFTHVGVLVWRFDPVPLAVAVSAQPPGVVQRRGVGPAPAEDDHHAVGAARVAHAGAVLDPLARAVAAAVQS